MLGPAGHAGTCGRIGVRPLACDAPGGHGQQLDGMGSPDMPPKACGALPGHGGTGAHDFAGFALPNGPTMTDSMNGES